MYGRSTKGDESKIPIPKPGFLQTIAADVDFLDDPLPLPFLLVGGYHRRCSRSGGGHLGGLK